MPIFAGVRSDTSSALITATSVSGSVPMTSARAVEPSLKLTEIVPPPPAASTTWLLVRISPSELRITPEPDPWPPGPATLIFTTDGSTEAATSSTEPGSAGASWLSETGVLVRVSVGALVGALSSRPPSTRS